jgi:16S rRNA processing protein RimM
VPATGSTRSLTSPTTDGTSATPASELLDVGRVVKPHGLTGELVVDLWSSIAARLEPGATLSSDAGTLEVTSSRPHQGRYLVRFSGVVDRRQAEALRGVVLRAPAVDIAGTLWVHELVGAEVVTTGGRTLGTVVAVEANPASDLLVLTGGGLVPVRFVTSFEPRTLVTVDVPEGLVEEPDA